MSCGEVFLSIWKMWRVRKQPKRVHRKLRYGSKFLSDLTDCINEPNLPGKYAQGNSSYGRITKGAAYAFRGYTYQFMGDYAKALADFEAIEGLGYALYSPSNGVKGNRDFFQLFKPANEQCDEMIFSVQCVETSGMGKPERNQLW